MSAIWGFISLEKDIDKVNKRISECREIMTKPYKECAIDRYEEEIYDTGFFSCGIQYFTDEAEYERLPVRDEKRGIIFTGDIVLNARDELINELKSGLSDTEIKDLGDVLFGTENSQLMAGIDIWPDGALSYAAYLLWNNEFVDHIQGLFAIAVYDTVNHDFKLFSDHMGCRCVYYSVCGKELFFSSLCRPITDAMPSEYYGICEKFIAGAEYSDTPAMLLFPGLSPFDNVYQLIRGHYLEAKSVKGIFKEKNIEYYNPAKNKRQRMKLQIPRENPDDYCREVFRKVFWDCVTDAIRSKTEISATISSGLDSTSVAAVAASLLEKEGKKLYGYTSVPLKDYINTTYDPYYITDESDGVKRFCKEYNNIEMEFLSCEGKSAFTDMDEYIRKFEIPCKALINQVWMMEIIDRMKEKGSKVMLNGQFGNFTLSTGSAFSRTYHELFRGNIKEAKKQLAAFGKRYSVPRKALFRDLVGTMFRRLLFMLDLDMAYNRSFDQHYLKKELLKKHKVKKTERTLYKMRGYTSCEPRSKQDNAIMDATLCGTMDIYDAKISIYYGVLQRDPTMDKRMVDLCIALPDYAFADDGLERRLVRDYLDDMIPDSIRNDCGHRGIQSPDALLRIQKYGKKKEGTDLSKQLFKYLDERNVRDLFNQEIREDNYRDIVRIMALDMFLEEFG